MIKTIKYWIIRNWMRLFKKKDLWRVDFGTMSETFRKGDVMTTIDGNAWECLGRDWYRLIKTKIVFKNGVRL